MVISLVWWWEPFGQGRSAMHHYATRRLEQIMNSGDLQRLEHRASNVAARDAGRRPHEGQHGV
jgi:hypothetical protein